MRELAVRDRRIPYDPAQGMSLPRKVERRHRYLAASQVALLADELAAHIAGHGDKDLVFTTPTGQPMRNRNARPSWFDRAAQAIAEPELTPQGYGTPPRALAVSAGANVKALQRMLGHASATPRRDELDRYADLFEDDLEAVAERLDAIARAADVYPPCTRR